MEELIDLLNEYEKIREKLKEDEEQQYKREKSIIGEGVWRCDTFDTWEGDNIMSDVAPSYIISKSYGFIKWLVDNDKIDFEKIKEQTKCKNIVGGEEFLDFDIERDFTPYEEILMWLAIQDEPIEFLISILK